MLTIIKDIVDKTKYNTKCPYVMTPTSITIHNTGNDASAKNEIAYMKKNDSQVSYHIAVDDIEIRQGIELNRNAWHAGNRTGNLTSIAIEICYSKSGGEKFLKAEKNAAELTAYLLKKYGWGIDKVKRHKDWSGKDCPHLTMKLGWDRFLKMVEDYLKKMNTETNKTTTSTATKTTTSSAVTKTSSTTNPTTKTTTISSSTTTTLKDRIKKLQTSLNKSYSAKLVVDGIRGTKTDALLKKHILKNYTANEYVKWVQTELNLKGYKLTVDGKYGTATTNAVKKFQEKNNLTKDGIVGFKTVCKLLSK